MFYTSFMGKYENLSQPTCNLISVLAIVCQVSGVTPCVHLLFLLFCFRGVILGVGLILYYDALIFLKFLFLNRLGARSPTKEFKINIILSIVLII